MFGLFSSAQCQALNVCAEWDYREKYQQGSLPTGQVMGRPLSYSERASGFTNVLVDREVRGCIPWIPGISLLVTASHKIVLVNALRWAGNTDECCL